jgi:PAS domain S-box-containing protein
MWHSFRSWLNNAPIDNPIERRQAPMLQIMLIGITIAASLALVNILVAPVSTERRLLGIAVNTLYILSAIGGLAALRWGNFRLAVLIPTTTSALILGMFLIAVGLRNGAPFLIVFTIPIILAGLLAGRSSIFLIIGIGVATMLITLTLERVAPTLIGFVRVGDSTSTIVVVFILVTSVSGLFLDRFGHTLSTTLSETLARERELEQSRAALELRTSELEREIGQRTKAEAALQASEARYRQIVETAQEGIWLLDAANVITFANAKMADILGYSVEAMIGASVFTFVTSEAKAQAQAKLARRRQGIAEQHDITLRRSDGATVWALINASPVLDSAGSYAGALAMISDITERKHAELAVRQSEARFAAAFHASAAAMLLTSASDGRFIDVNARYEQLFGYARDELVGQTGDAMHIYTSPEQRAEIVRLFLEQGSLRDLELDLRARSGELRTVLSSLEGFELDRETYLLGTMIDITERKRAEADVRALNAELEARVAARTAALEAANKELEAFAYSVSHDLRAPLRAIDGFARILREDYTANLPDEAQQYFEYIRENAQRMGHLIDDLLAFARLSRQPLTKGMVNIAELVRQCLHELQAEQAKRQIAIRVGELPSCAGDRSLLKQVWLNLLSNALKYTGKRISAEITVGSQRESGETIYFVKDNGAGFDMRYIGKLFGVFQRLHRAEEYEGTGVGLATVQRIVLRHGGRIWAEAGVNQGATFYFTLGSEGA